MGLVSCVLKSALLWGKYQKNVWIALRKTFGPEFQIMYCWCREVSHSPFLQVLDSFPPLLCPLLLRSATYTRTKSVVFKPYYSWILYRIHRLHSPLSHLIPLRWPKGLNLCQILLAEDPKPIYWCTTCAPKPFCMDLAVLTFNQHETLWQEEKLLLDNDAIGALQMMAP